MRPPRLRFTVRGLMVAVAVGAAALGAWELMRRRENYAFRAALRSSMIDRRLAQGDPREDPKLRRWEGQMRRYQRAARYPWLSVEPYPPEPK
jgi:hypothetical protein